MLIGGIPKGELVSQSHPCEIKWQIPHAISVGSVLLADIFYSPLNTYKMNLNDLFSGSTVQSIVKTIVEKTGLNESQASGALQAALPMILDVVSKKAGSGEGLSGLISGVVGNLESKGQGVVDKITGMIDKNKDGKILDDITGMFGGKKK